MYVCGMEGAGTRDNQLAAILHRLLLTGEGETVFTDRSWENKFPQLPTMAWYSSRCAK